MEIVKAELIEFADIDELLIDDNDEEFSSLFRILLLLFVRLMKGMRLTKLKMKVRKRMLGEMR